MGPRNQRCPTRRKKRGNNIDGVSIDIKESQDTFNHKIYTYRASEYIQVQDCVHIKEAPVVFVSNDKNV